MPTTVTAESEPRDREWCVREGETDEEETTRRRETGDACMLRRNEESAVWITRAPCSLSNLNARINAHWMRGKHRDRSDTLAAALSLFLGRYTLQLAPGTYAVN